MCTNLTSSLIFSPHIRLPFLLPCKSFLNFSNRAYEVIDFKGDLLVVNENAREISSTPSSRFIKTALKVIGWMTLILPMLAVLGAVAFHLANRLISNRKFEEIKAENQQIPDLQKQARELQAKNQSQTQELEQIRKENQEQIGRLEKQTRELQETIQKQAQELEQIRQVNGEQIGRLQEQARELQAKNQSQTQELEQIRKENQGQIRRFEEQIRELQETIQKQDQELEQIRQANQGQIGRLQEAENQRTSSPEGQSGDVDYELISSSIPALNLEQKLYDYITNFCIKSELENNRQIKNQLANSYVQEKIAIIDSGRSKLWYIKENHHNSNRLASQNEEDYHKQNVASIIWFLMAKALEKNQGFEEGSFIIEDPDDKLYNYLNISIGKYARISSHLKYQSQKVTHYGLDFSEGLLPAQKKHLLFFQFIDKDTNKKFLFMKPENHGLQNWDDYFAHGYEYGLSLFRKIGGSDESAHWKKERIPHDIVKKFASLLKEVPNAQQILDQVGSSGKGEGIQAIIKFLRTQQNLSEELKVFHTSLENHFDHLEYRIGCEVRFGSELWDSLQDPLIKSEEDE